MKAAKENIRVIVTLVWSYEGHGTLDQTVVVVTIPPPGVIV